MAMEYKRYWPYDINDTSTWKYIDFVMTGTLKGRTANCKYWILNPDFKYEHLDPNHVKKENELRTLNKGAWPR